MGLKDQLIQRANEGNKKPEKQPAAVEEVEEDLDLRSFFQDEDDVMAPMFEEPMLDNNSFDDSGLQFDEEPEPMFEPAPQPQYQPQQYQQPQYQPQYQPQQYQQPQYQPQPEPVYEPAPQPQYQPQQYQPEVSYNQPMTANVDDTNLQAKLLKKAKFNVLTSITEEFTSSILTSDALTKLVESYINEEASDLTYSSYVFVALIDEIISKEYTHSYYGDLTNEILESIKSDLIN